MSYNPNAAQGPGRKMKRVIDMNVMGPAVPTNQPYMQPAPAANMFPSHDPMMGNSGFVGNQQQQQTVNLGTGFNNGSSVPMQNQSYGYAAPQPPTSQPQAFGPQVAYSGAPAGVAPGVAPGMPGSMAGGMPGSMAGGMPGGMPDSMAGGMPGSMAGGMPMNPNQMPQFAMFQQPIVQDMAMQYGQRLADQGKQLVENQFEKYVPVAKLKYYFAVDNKYVINKMRLLFFPFTHKDWSLKYDQENPVQPRYDINAPDLYIPTMAYITYVVVAGLMLGMQNRFTPEQLGIQASSALAYSIFELVVYSITLYVVNIKTNLKTLDLLAFSGYKFVIIVAALLASTLFHAVGYYATLAYSSLTLGFFLLRTLKTKVLNDTPAATTGAINYDPYGNPQQLDYSGGRKRKLYFLFLIVGGQAFLAFMLSKHLYLPDKATLEARNMVF